MTSERIEHERRRASRGWIGWLARLYPLALALMLVLPVIDYGAFSSWPSDAALVCAVAAIGVAAVWTGSIRGAARAAVELYARSVDAELRDRRALLDRWRSWYLIRRGALGWGLWMLAIVLPYDLLFDERIGLLVTETSLLPRLGMTTLSAAVFLAGGLLFGLADWLFDGRRTATALLHDAPIRSAHDVVDAPRAPTS